MSGNLLIKEGKLIDVLDKDIVDLVIPEGVVSIATLLIGTGISILCNCTKLKTITLPSTLKTINSSFFDFSLSLEKIIVNENNLFYSSVEGVLYSKDKTTLIKFPNNKIVSNFTIPSSVKNVANRAFLDCSINEIIVSNGVEVLEDLAFYCCRCLEKILIPSSVIYIGSEALGATPNLVIIEVDNNNRNYKSIDNVLFDFNVTTLIKYPSSLKNKIYCLPKSVIKISEYAFVKCSKLFKIILNDGLEVIESNNFNNCKIGYINIPASVNLICEDNFQTSSLKAFDVDKNNDNYKDIEGILFNKDCSAIIKYPSANTRINYTIPSTVLHIHDNAFLVSHYLENIVLNDELKSIGSRNFMLFNSLKSIVIKSNLSSIGMYSLEFKSSVLIIIDAKNKSFCLKDNSIFDIVCNCKLEDR